MSHFDEDAKVGDIVLCWRPSLLLSEHYEARVVRVIGESPVYEVIPIHGLFRFKRFVEQSFMAGIIHAADPERKDA